MLENTAGANMNSPTLKIYLILFDADRNRLDIDKSFSHDERNSLYDRLYSFTSVRQPGAPCNLPLTYPHLTCENDGKNAFGFRYKHRDHSNERPPIPQEWLDQHIGKEYTVSFNRAYDTHLKGKTFIYRYEYDA